MFNEELHIGDLVYVLEEKSVCQVLEFPNDVSVIFQTIPGNVKVGFSREDITTVHLLGKGSDGEMIFASAAALAESLLKHREAIYKYAVHAIEDYINQVEFGDDKYDMTDGYTSDMLAAVNILHDLGFGERIDILRRVRIGVLRERVNNWIVPKMSHEGIEIGDYVEADLIPDEDSFTDGDGFVIQIQPDELYPFTIYLPDNQSFVTPSREDIRLKEIFS